MILLIIIFSNIGLKQMLKKNWIPKFKMQKGKNHLQGQFNSKNINLENKIRYQFQMYSEYINFIYPKYRFFKNYIFFILLNYQNKLN